MGSAMDFYAAVALKLLGINREMYLPIFIANRLIGWGAHILEQKQNNILLYIQLFVFSNREK